MTRDEKERKKNVALIVPRLISVALFRLVWSHPKWTALSTGMNAPKTHWRCIWGPLTQAAIGGCLGRIWPNDYSFVNANASASSYLLQFHNGLKIFLHFSVFPTLIYLCRPATISTLNAAYWFSIFFLFHCRAVHSALICPVPYCYSFPLSLSLSHTQTHWQ